MHITGKKILILGGTGSLGRALIYRLMNDNDLMLYSRDEAKHWTIRNEVNNPRVMHAVGDIRDYARVEEVVMTFQPHIILIASALKQVDTCENSPYESIQTNILGIKNVVDAVTRNVDRLPHLSAINLISTDKACAPTNVYGMCKAIAERLVTSQYLNHKNPRFIAVRYGNVLESRGSIIPLFRWQAENSDYLTVTHEDMTRFVMTLDQSIDLILNAVQNASSGDVFLPRLKSMRIIDLATIFADRFNKKIKIVGIRPGEKLHEDLISESESIRVTRGGDTYRMAPAHKEIAPDAEIFTYTSNQDVMSKEELTNYLEEIGILDKRLSDFIGREIEEIDTHKVVGAVVPSHSSVLSERTKT